MQADIEGAARIASLAVGFDWAWAKDDIERFSRAAGWTLDRHLDSGDVTLLTDLRVNLNCADAFCNRRFIRGRNGRDESLDRIEIYITDVVRSPGGDNAALLEEYFDQFSEKLIRELGRFSHTESKPEAEIGWEEGICVINVRALPTLILLEIVNPRYWIERKGYADDDLDWLLRAAARRCSRNGLDVATSSVNDTSE